MVELVVSLSLPLGLLLAVAGAVWIYRDASNRGMDTADMWAVGFFVGFIFPPIVGGLVVLAVYLQKRNRRGERPSVDDFEGL